jgi:hypothetical protein
MSMTNENSQDRWELGDAITIRVPTEPDPEAVPENTDEDTPPT